MSNHQPEKRQPDWTQIIVALIGVLGIVAGGFCGVVNVVIPLLQADPTPVPDIVIAATLNAQATFDAVATGQVMTVTAAAFTATTTPAPTDTPTATITITASVVPPTSTETSLPSATVTASSTDTPTPTVTVMVTSPPVATLAPTATPIPPTATPVQRTFPCEAQVDPFSVSGQLNVVRQFPNSTSRIINGVERGQIVVVIERSSGVDIYYRIASSGQTIGWIHEDYLDLSSSCP